MATLRKNVWFVALDKRGNIVEDDCGLALMGKKKADVQEEVNCYYPATYEDVTVEKVEIEISRYF